jgi:Inosine-uridine nucleoside N-ribohydrolase
MAQRIILDCDPGIDDALAIAFAHGHPGIELVGITTVAGNVGLAKTTANALAVSEFVGAAGTPVTAGCAGPLLRPALDARHVHGDSGLGGAVLPPATASPALRGTPSTTSSTPWAPPPARSRWSRPAR